MIRIIETYLNSLSEDMPVINITAKNIDFIPDLTRFKNIKSLYCSYNELTSLPHTLPENIKILYCSNNQLTSLPILPQNLKILSCSNNQLTSLHSLPENLEQLYCSNNQLTSLPTLPQNLKILCCGNNLLNSLPTLPKNLEQLYCCNNQLDSLPTLPQNLEQLSCGNNKLACLPTLPKNLKQIYYINNTIYEIVNSNSLFQIKKNIQIINNLRYLYYCLKFKKQLRKWLWEKVREPNIMKIYHPNYLIENLGDEDDLDIILSNWISCNV
jgi:Leucine-rich repeat (LRR) protein